MKKDLDSKEIELVSAAKEHGMALLQQAFQEAQSCGVRSSANGGPQLFPKGITKISVQCAIGVTQFVTLSFTIDVEGPTA